MVFGGTTGVYERISKISIPNEYERWGNNHLNSKSTLRNLSVGVLIYVNNDDIISAYVMCMLRFVTSSRSENRYGVKRPCLKTAVEYDIYWSEQEPITRSEQLPCLRVAAFSWNSLFLERVGANFKYLLNSRKQSAKPTDLKMIFFCLLITFSFPF